METKFLIAGNSWGNFQTNTLSYSQFVDLFAANT